MMNLSLDKFYIVKDYKTAYQKHSIIGICVTYLLSKTVASSKLTKKDTVKFKVSLLVTT